MHSAIACRQGFSHKERTEKETLRGQNTRSFQVINFHFTCEARASVSKRSNEEEK